MSWLDKFFGGIAQVQSGGVSLPVEEAINFASGFTLVDNPGNGSTDVYIASGGTFLVGVPLVAGNNPAIPFPYTVLATSDVEVDTTAGPVVLTAPGGGSFGVTDSGGAVDTYAITLLAPPSIYLQNPIDGGLYAGLVWGQGSGGQAVPPYGPTLTTRTGYIWTLRTNVANLLYFSVRS